MTPHLILITMTEKDLVYSCHLLIN